MVKNLRTKLCVLSLVLQGLAVTTAATAIAVQKPQGDKPVNQALVRVKYRLAKSYRTVSSQSREYSIQPTLVILISIDPGDFNQKTMIALAARLNKDFSTETRLEALIFSSHAAAKKFTPSEESPDYAMSWKAFRGGYHLDRAKGEENVSFSTDPNASRVTITLNGNSSAAVPKS